MIAAGDAPEASSADGDVDAVIAWVDGNDRVHAEKRRALARGRLRSAAADPTRFATVARWSIAWPRAALRALAACHPHRQRRADPGTDPKLREPFSNRAVRVVDHRGKFRRLRGLPADLQKPEHRSMLWRVPGLAERFIYLTMISTCSGRWPGMIFSSKGARPAACARWRRRPGRAGPEAGGMRACAVSRKPAAVSNHGAQQLDRRKLGFRGLLSPVPHCPHRCGARRWPRTLPKHPEQLAANVAHRLRAAEQFLLSAVADHW